MSLPHGEAEEEPMARREPSVRLTYEDYLNFPDDKRYELIDGEAFVVPSPNTRHQVIFKRLLFEVERHLRENPVGDLYPAPFDVVLADGDVLQPDLVYVAAADKGVVTHANIRGAPSWVIEILSPSTRSRDLSLKRQAYERAGVPELWFVDPEEDAIHVLTLRGGRYEETALVRPPERVRPACLPDLELDLGEIFGA